MPIMPHGPLEGAEFHRWKTTRKPDDHLPIGATNEGMKVLRVSLGGTERHGFYNVFRGEPEEIVKLLEMALEIMRGIVNGTASYEDKR